MDSVDATGFSLSWQPVFAPQGIQGYEIAWNGLVVDLVDGTTARVDGITINPRPQNYAWVRAVANDGVRSAPSSFVIVATADRKAPAKPTGLHVSQRFPDGFTVSWDPASDDVGVKSYQLTIGKAAWSVPGAVTEITVRRKQHYRPATEYKLALVAIDGARNRSPACDITAVTADANTRIDRPPAAQPIVAPPMVDPIGRFAIVVATDGRIAKLRAAFADAEQAACAFVLVKGQIVPQLSSNPAHWDAVAAAVESCTLPVLLSPLSVKDTWSTIHDTTTCFNARSWGSAPANSRYDMMVWRTGQPLNQLYPALNDRLWVAAQCENPRGNPRFAPLLEQWVHAAERDPTCQWFITAGITPESFPTGVGEVILQLHRPTIDVMRMINGDRGHELAWESGSNIACVCPQRSRSGGHYLVSVEPERLVFTARQQIVGGKMKDDGHLELRYDRSNNHLSAQTCRLPHPAGISVGPPKRIETGPAWTQNRFAGTKSNRSVTIQLLGRSPRNAPLRFKLVQAPQHGQVRFDGDRATYTPETDFHGTDVFRYRADDGGPWPANTAWVQVQVGNLR